MLALFSCLQEMNTVPYLSKDQIATAREMDLLTYLRRFDPEELVHIGGNTYTTRTHDSLKISNGKWCWWSRNIGGTNALDYLTRVEGLSFLDAVQRILGELPRVPPTPMRTAPLLKTEFILPNTPTTGVFLHICGAGALMRRSSTTASSTGSFTRMPSVITAYSWVMNMESLPMVRCAELFRIPPLPVKSPAVISGFPLPFPSAPVAKPSVYLKLPLTPFLT